MGRAVNKAAAVVGLTASGQCRKGTHSVHTARETRAVARGAGRTVSVCSLHYQIKGPHGSTEMSDAVARTQTGKDAVWPQAVAEVWRAVAGFWLFGRQSQQHRVTDWLQKGEGKDVENDSQILY